MTLFDLTEEPRAMGDLPAEPVVPTPQPFDGYRDAVRYDVGLVRSAVVETVKTARSCFQLHPAAAADRVGGR